MVRILFSTLSQVHIIELVCKICALERLAPMLKVFCRLLAIILASSMFLLLDSAASSTFSYFAVNRQFLNMGAEPPTLILIGTGFFALRRLLRWQLNKSA
jgi:hypothetical protein